MQHFFCALIIFFTLPAFATEVPFLSPTSEQCLKVVSETDPFLYEKMVAQLAPFKEQYTRFLTWSALDKPKIPKILHFVALGARVDLSAIDSWQKQNPDYAIWAWVDHTQLKQNVIIKDIKQLNDSSLAPFFKRAIDENEKRQLLEFEILHRFGGVVVDLNMEALCSLDEIISKCTFFAALNEISPMAKQQLVHVGTAVVGATAAHPCIQKTMEIIVAEWDNIENDFLKLSMTWIFKDDEVCHLRLAQSVLPLTFAINIQGLGERDVLLPPPFFHYGKSSEPLIARNKIAEFYLEQQFKERQAFFLKPYAKECFDLRLYKTYLYSLVFVVAAALFCIASALFCLKVVKNK